MAVARQRTRSARGQRAARPQPQTTVEPPGGPFLRHSHPGRRPVYKSTGNAASFLVAAPLVSAPGYLSRLRIAGIMSGATGVAAVYQADAPFSSIGNILFKDAFGTILYSGGGWELLYCLPKYSGQYGLFAMGDVRNFPSWSAGSTAGNFTFRTALPLEFAKGYGLISVAAADLLPTLQFNGVSFSTGGPIYSTQPSGGTLAFEVDTAYDFYWLPEGHEDEEPPGLGTTLQYVQTQGNPNPGNAFARVAAPRLGGYLTDVIFVARDLGASSARVDAWPDPLQLYIDGTPVIDTALADLSDDMNVQFGFSSAGTFATSAVTNTNADALAAAKAATPNARPLGSIAWSRRTSLNQMQLGLLDSLEQTLSTNPGTQIEIAGTWQSGTGPYQIEILAGQIVPRGSLAFGLPEL